MTTKQIEITTTPASAKQDIEIYQLWVIDDDIHTPDAAYEDIPPPWYFEADDSHQYVLFIHAKIPGATKVKVKVDSEQHEWELPNDKILKRMMYI